LLIARLSSGLDRSRGAVAPVFDPLTLITHPSLPTHSAVGRRRSISLGSLVPLIVESAGIEALPLSLIAPHRSCKITVKSTTLGAGARIGAK
jgi:hypothetical protein